MAVTLSCLPLFVRSRFSFSTRVCPRISTTTTSSTRGPCSRSFLVRGSFSFSFNTPVCAVLVVVPLFMAVSVSVLVPLFMVALFVVQPYLARFLRNNFIHSFSFIVLVRGGPICLPGAA